MKEAANPKAGERFQDVLTFLESVAEAQGVSLPSDSESLFDQGVLDSFGLLEFLGFLEETCDIKIPDDDLTPGKFETIGRIREYVESRMGH